MIYGVVRSSTAPCKSIRRISLSEALRNFLFTSESVTEGHPDKIADQISDAVLDAVLEQDRCGSGACEVLIPTERCVVAGEITTTCDLNFPRIVRQTIQEMGYTDANFGFDCKTCGVVSAVQ